jgi:hypothetical protein
MSAMGSASPVAPSVPFTGWTTVGRRGSGATAFGPARTSMTGLEVDPEAIAKGR